MTAGPDSDRIEPMGRDLHQFEILENRILTENLRELVFDWKSGPKPFQFQTGQFVMLQVPAERSTTGKPVQRAYSIGSPAQTPNRLHLLVKLVPNGIASEYVRTMKPNQIIDFTGPFGKCFFKTPPPKNVLFLCTGAGLSQHYSMLASEASNYQSTQYRLLIGVWNENETFYLKELEELKRKIPLFSYDFVIDKPVKNWPGLRGHVTDYVSGLSKTDTHLYLCGNPAMIESAKEMLIDTLGFDKDDVVIEAFNSVKTKA